MLISLLTAHAILLADPDAVVTTAPGTPVALSAAVQPDAPSVTPASVEAAAPHDLTTDEQIERWLSSRTPDATPFAASPEPRDDGRVHGEVFAGIGTGDFSEVGGSVSVPLGDRGRLGFSFSKVENGYRPYGYGYDHPFFDDSGYVFPGDAGESAPYSYERRTSRPEGPPRRGAMRPTPRLD